MTEPVPGEAGFTEGEGQGVCPRVPPGGNISGPGVVLPAVRGGSAPGVTTPAAVLSPSKGKNEYSSFCTVSFERGGHEVACIQAT